MEAREISQKKLAKIMSISYTMLNEILNWKRNVSTQTALLSGTTQRGHLFI